MGIFRLREQPTVRKNQGERNRLGIPHVREKPAVRVITDSRPRFPLVPC